MPDDFDIDDLEQLLKTEEAQVQPVALGTPVVTVDPSLITMENAKFATFLSLLQFLNNNCVDLLIKNGKILQLNTPRSIIFEIDATPLFGDITLPISNISSKFSLLQLFRQNNVNVSFQMDDSTYSFKDARSKFTYTKPNMQFLGNTSWDRKQLDDSMAIDKKRPILSCKLEKMILTRIKTISNTLQSALFRIEFKGSTAKLTIVPDEASKHTIADIRTFKDELNDTTLYGGAVFNVQAIASFVDAGIEEIDLTVYHRTVTTPPSVAIVLSSKFQIGSTDESLPVTVYSQGKLLSQDELERV